jgi:hypothetical protein
MNFFRYALEIAHLQKAKEKKLFGRAKFPENTVGFMHKNKLRGTASLSKGMKQCVRTALRASE